MYPPSLITTKNSTLPKLRWAILKVSKQIQSFWNNLYLTHDTWLYGMDTRDDYLPPQPHNNHNTYTLHLSAPSVSCKNHQSRVVCSSQSAILLFVIAAERVPFFISVRTPENMSIISTLYHHHVCVWRLNENVLLLSGNATYAPFCWLSKSGHILESRVDNLVVVCYIFYFFFNHCSIQFVFVFEFFEKWVHYI